MTHGLDLLSHGELLLYKLQQLFLGPSSAADIPLQAQRAQTGCQPQESSSARLPACSHWLLPTSHTVGNHIHFPTHPINFPSQPRPSGFLALPSPGVSTLLTPGCKPEHIYLWYSSCKYFQPSPTPSLR